MTPAEIVAAYWSFLDPAGQAAAEASLQKVWDLMPPNGGTGCEDDECGDGSGSGTGDSAWESINVDLGPNTIGPGAYSKPFLQHNVPDTSTGVLIGPVPEEQPDDALTMMLNVAAENGLAVIGSILTRDMLVTMPDIDPLEGLDPTSFSAAGLAMADIQNYLASATSEFVRTYDIVIDDWTDIILFDQVDPDGRDMSSGKMTLGVQKGADTHPVDTMLIEFTMERDGEGDVWALNPYGSGAYKVITQVSPLEFTVTRPAVDTWELRVRYESGTDMLQLSTNEVIGMEGVRVRGRFERWG